MLLDTFGPCDFAFIGIRDSPVRSAVHRRCGSTWIVFINGRVGYNAYWYTHTLEKYMLVLLLLASPWVMGWLCWAIMLRARWILMLGR